MQHPYVCRRHPQAPEGKLARALVSGEYGGSSHLWRVPIKLNSIPPFLLGPKRDTSIRYSASSARINQVQESKSPRPRSRFQTTGAASCRRLAALRPTQANTSNLSTGGPNLLPFPVRTVPKGGDSPLRLHCPSHASNTACRFTPCT